MTEPTVTQSVRALMESKGTTLVLLALLGRYWAAITGTLGVAVGLGIVIEQGREMKTELKDIKAQQITMSDRLGTVETHWQALFDAAHVVVVPNPPPITVAPVLAPAPVTPARRRK